MSVMVAELYDALVSAGADDGKAREAACAMADYDSRFESRFDAVDKKLFELKSAVDKELFEVKSDIKLLRWMLTVVFALNATILIKLFLQ